MSTQSHADDVVAAVQQVDLLCGGNAHLMEDNLIGRIAEFAANGRFTMVHGIETDNYPLSSEPRILPAVTVFGARHVDGIDTDRPRVNVLTRCDRCDGEYVNTTGRAFLIPAGTAAVEFHVCLMCVDYLNENFGPVHWRE